MASMPCGREIYGTQPFVPPQLDSMTLERMRAPPDREDGYGGDNSSDEDEGLNEGSTPVGAFPGSKVDYSGSGNYF